MGSDQANSLQGHIVFNIQVPTSALIPLFWPKNGGMVSPSVTVFLNRFFSGKKCPIKVNQVGDLTKISI